MLSSWFKSDGADFKMRLNFGKRSLLLEQQRLLSDWAARLKSQEAAKERNTWFHVKKDWARVDTVHQRCLHRLGRRITEKFGLS